MTDSISHIAEARVGAWVQQHERAQAQTADHVDPDTMAANALAQTTPDAKPVMGSRTAALGLRPASLTDLVDDVGGPVGGGRNGR